MDWPRIALRRLGEARAPAVGIALVVLLTAFVAAVGPLLLSKAADTTLRSAVSAAPVDVRNLQLLALGRIWAAGDPMATVAANVQELESRFPTAVRTLITARESVVDTSRWVVTSRPVEERTIRLRIQPGAADHVRILQGRLPQGRGRNERCPGWRHRGGRTGARHGSRSCPARRVGPGPRDPPG